MGLCRKVRKIKKQEESQHDNLPKWYNKAIHELDVAEIVGKKHNPRIIEYHQETTLKAKTDETSWCSSFVNWVFQSSGIKGTRSATARSWLNWGITLEEPKKGCVVIFWRGSVSGWKGHVAFYVRENDKYVYVLGGNQSNRVSIAKYKKSRILGYRWPSMNTMKSS
jgi:uncharacterized protein (TIGR02594 family)